MDYFKNHCWCSHSHWNDGHYNCEIIVSIYRSKDYYKEDWSSLMTSKAYFDEEYAIESAQRMEAIWKKNSREYTDEDLKDYKEMVGTKEIHILKPEIMEWLKENVPDTKEGKGWCVGSDHYTATDSGMSYPVFFQRRKDAMAFIKRWSKWKRPLYYTQYFTDIRKKLNMETGKYEQA